jgi:hypothetical protein
MHLVIDMAVAVKNFGGGAVKVRQVQAYKMLNISRYGKVGQTLTRSQINITVLALVGVAEWQSPSKHRTGHVRG